MSKFRERCNCRYQYSSLCLSSSIFGMNFCGLPSLSSICANSICKHRVALIRQPAFAHKHTVKPSNPASVVKMRSLQARNGKRNLQVGADLLRVVSNCICDFVITFTLYTYAAICHRQYGDVSALGYHAHTYFPVSLQYYRFYTFYSFSIWSGTTH